LSISFRSLVKNEVAQPRFSSSAGTEEGILLGSFLSLDIPDAAIKTDAILFGLGQPPSLILVNGNSVSLPRLTEDVFRLATLAIVHE
jgi:hypothetical protein